MCAGPFVDFDNTQLPAEVIAVTPQALAGRGRDQGLRAGHPPPGTASGTYMGTLMDSPGGRCVAEEVGVYVVGDHAP